MALTVDQEISLYEILEVPYDDSVTIPVGEFYLSSVEYISSNNDKKMQTRITDRLTNMSSSVEARLVESINKWDLLSTNTVSFEGSIGGLQGVEFDPNQQLARIKARVLTLVPVMQYHRELTNQALSMPMNITAIR